MGSPNDMSVGKVQAGKTNYIDFEKLDKEKEKELATKPSYNNVGGGPSVFLAYTKTNSVGNDGGEGATCFYS